MAKWSCRTAREQCGACSCSWPAYGYAYRKISCGCSIVGVLEDRAVLSQWRSSTLISRRHRWQGKRARLAGATPCDGSIGSKGSLFKGALVIFFGDYQPCTQLFQGRCTSLYIVGGCSLLLIILRTPPSVDILPRDTGGIWRSMGSSRP